MIYYKKQFIKKDKELHTIYWAKRKHRILLQKESEFIKKKW